VIIPFPSITDFESAFVISVPQFKSHIPTQKLWDSAAKSFSALHLDDNYFKELILFPPKQSEQNECLLSTLIEIALPEVSDYAMHSMCSLASASAFIDANSWKWNHGNWMSASVWSSEQQKTYTFTWTTEETYWFT